LSYSRASRPRVIYRHRHDFVNLSRVPLMLRQWCELMVDGDAG